jgi:hypothetical protein
MIMSIAKSPADYQRSAIMNGRTLLIGAVLPILSGCLNYTMPLAYFNPSVSAAKQGQDCQMYVFGIGGHGPDLNVAQAIRVGGITKLRTAEYRANEFQGIGKDCVVAYGE